LLLLILLLAQTATGYLGMTNGRESRAWILGLHGVVAYALVVLFFFKLLVVLDAWRRKKRWTAQRGGFLVSFVLLIVVLLSGLLWTLHGPIDVGGFSLVSLHIYIAVPLMILMLWHAWQMRFIRRVEGATGRRLFLAGLASMTGGLILWASAGRVKAWAGLLGAARRFTGSYENGSYTGAFPVVSWIADRPPPVDLGAWLLQIEGAVERPLRLTYEEILARPQVEVAAILDCTGGWYTAQRWQGLRLADLLAEVGTGPSAASVTFEAVSGYKRRFALAEAEGFLLALGTLNGEDPAGATFRPLDHGHGYPARLAATGRRGVEWVKWVTRIQVNETGPHAQSPLPLQ
jgi:DMSO/TMAO reductase YedYZ molybdopterin-dependent catalytic subunit